MAYRSETKAVEKQALQEKLKDLAEEIVSDLSTVDPDHGRELLSDFVSELFFAAAEQRRKEAHRQKQAEGIAAAKAKGVRFGRTARPVPENFGKVHQAWRNGEMSLAQAAEACGMARGTFYNIAVRREQAKR